MCQCFAIGSAALVSLALFGAFVSRAGINSVDVLTPKVFIGLPVGAMLPYWFSFSHDNEERGKCSSQNG
jgi:Na+/H+-translocating membrane pyrophosphatase